MPCFEAVCASLAATVPSALPLFVRALCAEPAGAPRSQLVEQMQLAQRALQVLPPVLGQQPPRHSCAAAQQAALCCHAELLCLAGKHALGMWLALQPSSPGAPTEWASAVRLLEKECTGGGGSTRETLPLTAPLMFEVLALKVCDTLAPDETAAESAVSLMGVNAEDESETLAACVTHLFIAAKTVAAAIRRDAGAASVRVGHCAPCVRRPAACARATWMLTTRLLRPYFLAPRLLRRRGSRACRRACLTRCTTCLSKRCRAGAAQHA